MALRQPASLSLVLEMLMKMQIPGLHLESETVICGSEVLGMPQVKEFPEAPTGGWHFLEC